MDHESSKSILSTFILGMLFFVSTANALYFDGYGNYLAMGRNDDGSSSQIPLGFDLDFYDNVFDELFINNNGNVTFDRPMSTYTPYAFPSSEEIIAPFFADVDTRPADGGNVFYDHRNFRGESEFIATWSEVGYYSHHTDQLNTFQLIIQQDGDVGFSYGDMSWTRGDATPSDIHAVAGFDAGDNQNYLMLPGSRQASIASELENKEFWFVLNDDFGSGTPEENWMDQVDVDDAPGYASLEERANNAQWGGMEIRDPTSNNFETLISYTAETLPFNESEDTVVMIHGWERDADAEDALEAWQENMGNAFANRLGENNTNILAWNWSDNAATSWGSPNEFVPGEAINVARELRQLLGDDYSGNVHILGHSLGGGVATRATLHLQNDVNISELTIFDSPTQVANDVDLDQLLLGVNNGTYIQNYITHFGAAYTGGDINNFSMLAGDHSSAQPWYTRTIQNEAGSADAGFNRDNDERGTNWHISSSDFESDDRSENFNFQTGHHWRTNEQLITNNAQIVLSQADLNFYTTGEAWERDGVIYGQTNSPVFISSDLFLPVTANTLSFDLSIFEWSIGDLFSLFWDDNLLLSFATDALTLDQWYDFDAIDMSRWAGTNGTLTFGLTAVAAGAHSQFGVRNIQIDSISIMQVVPEPSTTLLFFLGLGTLMMISKRREYC